MNYLSPSGPYPSGFLTDVRAKIPFGKHLLLPRLASAACDEVVRIFGVPIELPLYCSLAAMTLGSQQNVDVQQPGGGSMPTSLKAFYVDDSSTSKSTVMSLFMREATSIESQFEAAASEIEEDAMRAEAWRRKHLKLVAALDDAKNRGKAEAVVKFQTEVELSRRARPRIRRRPKFITNDATIAGISKVYEVWPCFTVMTPEAGTTLDSELRRKDAHINLILDGEPVSRDRSTGVHRMSGARISFFFMDHPLHFKRYLDARGEAALDNGSLARADILSPGHFHIPQPLSSIHPELPEINAFGAALRDRLLFCIEQKISNTFTRTTLHLSKKAEEIWAAFTREVWSAALPGGVFAAIPAVARKCPNKALRFAATFHDFSGCPGSEISEELMQSAIELAVFLLFEWSRLLGPQPEEALDVQYARILLIALKKMIARGEPMLMPQSWLHPRVPELLRKQPALDIALCYLAAQGFLQLEDWPGPRRPKRFVRLNVQAITTSYFPGL